MKNKNIKSNAFAFRCFTKSLLIAGALIIGFMSFSPALHATNYTWDSTAGGGAPVDGSGTWDTTGTNWYSAGVDSAWVNLTSGTAVFGAANGTAGTITVGDVTAGGITFWPAGAGNYTLSGGTITLGGPTPTITSKADATIGSIIAGIDGLIKAGTNTLTLTGANTYTGTTTLKNGILVIGNATALGAASNPLALTTGTLDLNGIGTFVGALSGGGVITNNGGNTGIITDGGGTTQTFGGSINNGSGMVDFWTRGDGSTLNLTGVSTLGAFNIGQLNGTPYTLNLSGTVNAQYVNVGIDGGHGALNINGGLLNVGTPTNTLAIGGNGGGAGTVTLTSGTIIAPNVLSYGVGSSSLNLNGGVLEAARIGNDSAGSTLTVTIDGGKIVELGNYDGIFRPGAGTTVVQIGNGGLTIDSNGYSDSFVNLPMGDVSGQSGGFTKIGAGRLLLSTSNSYSGGTTVNAGWLQLGDAHALGATTGNLTVNGGGLELGGHSVTVGLLTGSIGGVIQNAFGGSVTLATNSALSGTYAGVINNGGGTVGLIKDGSGTLTLTGANTYSGGTTVVNGTLKMGDFNVLGGSTGAVVMNGGTLDLNGFGGLIGTLNGTGGVITNNGGDLILIPNGGGTTQTFGGSLNNGTGKIAVWLRGDGSTLNLTGVSSLQELNIGQLVNGAAYTVNLTGTLNAPGGVNIGRQGFGVLNVNGGLLNGSMDLGLENGSGTVTLTSGTIISPNTSSGWGPGNCWLNLNGGVLEAARIGSDGSGIFTVTINGSKIVELGNYDGIFRPGTGTTIVQIGNGGLTIDTNGYNESPVNLPMGDAPSASGPMTKMGAGNLTLTAANTYTGPTTVANGTLALSAGGSISANSDLILGVSLGTTGTFDVTAHASYSLANVSGNGTLNVGAGKTITATNNVSPGFGNAGKLNVTGNFTLASTAATALEIEGQSAGMFDILNVSDTFTYGGSLTVTSLGGYDLTQTATYALITAGTYSNSADFFSVTVNGVTLTNSGGVWSGSDLTSSYTFTESTGILAVAVPEPGTWAMLVGGFGILLVNRRQRRRLER